MRKLKRHTTSVARRNDSDNFALISRAYFRLWTAFVTAYPPVKREQLSCPHIYAINREDLPSFLNFSSASTHNSSPPPAMRSGMV